MPIYEYLCGNCSAQVEFIQKFSDSPKRKCPECGKSRLKRQISAAAFHLKGSGWYVTDFRDKGGKGKDAKDKDGGDTAKPAADAKPAKESKDSKKPKEAKPKASGSSTTAAAD